ncbi:putative nucleotidyltransferase, Ribonuclease H [Helianthus anomalus]
MRVTQEQHGTYIDQIRTSKDQIRASQEQLRSTQDQLRHSQEGLYQGVSAGFSYLFGEMRQAYPDYFQHLPQFPPWNPPGYGGAGPSYTREDDGDDEFWLSSLGPEHITDTTLEVSFHNIILRGVLLSFSLYFGSRIGDNAKFKCGEGVNFVNFVCPQYKKNSIIILIKYSLCQFFVCRLMSSTPAPAIAEPTDEPAHNLRRSKRLRERSLVIAQRIANAIDEPVIISEDESPGDEERVVMADDDRPLNETNQPGRAGLEPSILQPTIDTPTFEIRPSIINMVQNSVQFDGREHEDPGRHIAAFLAVCSTFRIIGVSEDAIRLRLFPFSLRDKARAWLMSLPAGPIRTWNQLAEQFMQKYFPPEKTNKLRNRIVSFRQDEGESLHAAWERFKDLLIDVPHHGFSKRQLVLTFYQGLSYNTQERLDVNAGGDLGTKTPTKAYDIIEKAALKSSSRRDGDRGRASSSSSRSGVHVVDDYTAITAQLSALTSRFDKSQMIAHAGSGCDQCGGSHEPGACFQGVVYEGHEEVDFVSNQVRPQNNLYSNTYNPGWRNHPNFGWRANAPNQNPLGFTQRAPAPQQGQQYQQYNQPYQQRPYSYQNQGTGSSSQQQAPQSSSKLEDMMAQLLSSSEKRYQQSEDRFLANEGEIRSQKASIQNTENQVGQLAQMMSKRPPGGLPGNTEPNPGGHRDVNAVMTRSGKTTGPVISDSVPITEAVPTDTPDEVQARLRPASTAQVQEPVKDYTPPVPYPGRLKKQKNEEQYGKFLELFKQLHINIPFVEALAQMPKYAKFLKDILSNKQKLEDISCVVMNETCSAVLQNRLPTKMGDPGSFTLPCLIGNMSVSHALADLGASINLMPYKVFTKLDLGEPSPTRMSIRLAGRSIKYPRGFVENMLVKIDKFVFPVDFVILDMDEDSRVPLILGRPFLNTARTIVDVAAGQITLRVNDEHVTFDIKRSMQHPQCHDDKLYYVDIVDACVCSHFQGTIDEIDSDTRLSCGDLIGITQEGHDFEQPVYQIGDDGSQSPERFLEISHVKEEEAEPSVEDPTPLELKELPPHLEYAFLDEERRLPVIISASLEKDEKNQLLEVLRLHKRAIAWKIMDIKGINPSFCTHKILMEDEYKPCAQHQRRLNPNMQDVVKKEVVPKKGGMTVVSNDRDELIPTRTVTGWRVCIDYRKLNDATRKDHFPLPFIDQMLERLSGKLYYCFLDGFSGYFQIPIAPEYQEKTTFTCPFGTSAYRRMPFGLCNAPATFQRCMVAIFHDMIEDSMEVFMDDFSVFGDSFDHCLENLRKMLKRCEETNLVLNWEKCHFMVKEGIVLGHKISHAGMEVDPAKVDIISRLPPPTSVRAIRSFLGHAGFYRRFIRDFSKIARPMTRLLEKDAPFIFGDDCLRAFDLLKRKLIEAPILVAPDWSLPFEIMCDASDYAIGAVLGQKREKHFHPIYYASKTLHDAQEHYTTTEKELLAVVFAFDKFRSYLVLSKTVISSANRTLNHVKFLAPLSGIIPQISLSIKS